MSNRTIWQINNCQGNFRLWTSGYDLFHIPNLPLYTCYDRSYRTLHWDDDLDKARSESWWQRDQRSKRRLSDIVTGKLSGIYGVGQARSIQDYRQFCVIDNINRTLENNAITVEGVFVPARRRAIETPQAEVHQPAFV